MKKILFILAMLLAFIGTRAQELPGDPPYTIDRAMSPWARNILNLNILEIFGRSDSIRVIFNYRDSTINVLKSIAWELEDTIDFEEGVTGWDEINKTLSTGLRRGSVLQHGRELVVDAINKTGNTIFNGQTVRVSGAQGINAVISLGNNKYDTTAFTIIGLATQDIPNNQSGFVTFFGEVRDIPTDSWPVKSFLWADSIDGGMTNTRPVAPNIAVVMGSVFRSHPTEGIIGVRVIPVFRLSWLSDVKAQGAQDNWDLLYWDTDSARWELTQGVMNLPNLSTYADNAAALVGGLVAGDLYKTNTGEIKIVY